MNANRRRHERLEIDHLAELVVGGRPFAQCRIRNYSQGGLYLQFDKQNAKDLRPPVNQADNHAISAFVQLQDLQHPSRPPYEIPVHIAFTTENSIGVAFMEPTQEVIHYLARHAKRGTPNQTKPNSADRLAGHQQLLTEIKQQLDSHLKAACPSLQTALMESLMERADKASQQEQPDLLFACSAIGNSSTELPKRFLSHIASSWDQLKQAPQKNTSNSDPAESMELVDQDEFNEWTAVVSVSRRIESKLSNTLHDISQCLAYLVRKPINSDSNPLSPYQLLWNYKKALDPTGISTSAREIIYAVFGEQILSRLEPFLHQIYATLEDRGITAAALAPPPDESTGSSSDMEGTSPRRRKPQTLIGALTGSVGRKKRTKQKTKITKQTTSRAGISRALEGMIQGDNRHLADRIEHQLGGHAAAGGGVTLDPESRQVIDATEQLLCAVQQDPRHSQQMRQLLRQIQLPLAKAAIHEPAVLNDPNHPARKLLNDIDQLALLTPTHDDSGLSQKTGNPLQSVLSSLTAAGGKADLQQVTDEISQLLEQRKGAFSNNLSQVVAGCDTDQLENSAVRQIRKFLSRELGENIPELIDQLLKLGWAGLLVETASQGAPQAKQLQAYGNALTMLIMVFQPERQSANLRPDKLAVLKKVLRKGFKAYPIYQKESDTLIAQIEEALQGDSPRFQQINRQRITVTEDYLEQLLPLASDISEGDSTTTVTPQWQQKIASLKVGEWITDQQHQGQVRVLNLAWRSPDAGRFVFVDGNGAKALDCSSGELAEGLQQGRFDLIEDGGLPMVERAVNRVLKQSFDKLRQESDQDNLTGLHNRRAYQRELQRLIKSCQQEQCQHILICMDIDRFSLINDLCGTEGGDQMLASIANICRSYLTRPGMLARTGDNEFSILIEHCTPDEGFRIAENQRKAIENYRFSWGGREASVTVSIGLADITSEEVEPDQISQAALSACIQAKSDGRNCCRRFQPEEEQFTQRQRLAQSVPLIERALNENSLDLYAQLISPVFVGDGQTEHHEILLRPLDEQGKPTSPFEFILAAEQYDRMRAVDRWVVKRFFNWAASETKQRNPENLGAFSINISGQSMMDESFGQFLIQQIKNAPIPPSQLAFEITETAVVTQINRARELMEAVRALGCQFFLDDFGSGYASYSYLKDFPVDVVKIDGIFIRELHQDKTSYAMVKSITEVAHHMKKLVVAEFVENEAILIALRELEVDYAQGYGIGRPTPLQSLLT